MHLQQREKKFAGVLLVEESGGQPVVVEERSAEWLGVSRRAVRFLQQGEKKLEKPDCLHVGRAGGKEAGRRDIKNSLTDGWHGE